MKLAIIGPYPVNPNNIQNGVEAVMVYLLEGLIQDSQLEIEVVSIRKDTAADKVQRAPNLVIHYLPSTKHLGNITLDIVDKYRTTRIITEIVPDIIHVHNHANYPYLFSQPPCPIITTVHGIIFKETSFDKKIIDRVRRLPRIFLEKYVLKRVPYLIGVSPYVIETIRPLSNGHIYIVENPVSSKYFKVRKEGTLNHLFYAGSIARRKNLLDLLKVVNILKSEVKNIELHIAGRIEDDPYYKILRKYMRDKNLDENIVFLGLLSDDQLLREYKRCSVFAFTSLEETSGMVIQQAMAAGKPVVAYRVGGIPYNIVDGHTGFIVEPAEITNFADKVKLLLRDSKLRLFMGENAKNEAIRRFTPEVVAKRTYAIFQELIQKKVGNNRG
jgi:glycosyltransferase involved in cell wall biosynthesis